MVGVLGGGHATMSIHRTPAGNLHLSHLISPPTTQLSQNYTNCTLYHVTNHILCLIQDTCAVKLALP